MAITAPRPRFAPLETFRCPGYTSLWSASVLWNQARWMDRVTLGWVVLVMTDSAWDLAVIEALRWVPLLIFGLAGGVVADRIDRRWVLIGAQTLALVVCAGIATLLLLGLFTFPLAALATFLLGLQWAIDWPTRRALIPDMVGRELTVNAMALDTLSMNLTRITGPLLAGALIAFQGPAAACMVMVGLYVVEIALLKRLPRLASGGPPGTGPMLRYLLTGLDRLRQSQAIVGVLVISVLMNVLIFPYQQLLPIFARDTLHVDAIGLGALSAAAGVGSVLGALAIVVSRSVAHPGLIFWTGSCVMSLGLVAFAITGNFGIALGALAVSGAGQAAFSSLQATIVLHNSADVMRGRALGALTLAIGSTPIGSLEVGAASVALGAPTAVALNAGACALLVALVALRLPRFRSA